MYSKLCGWRQRLARQIVLLTHPGVHVKAIFADWKRMPALSGWISKNSVFWCKGRC